MKKRNGPRLPSNYSRKYRYGVSKEFVDNLLYLQGNECAICCKHIAGRDVHIDHDHSTGNVRGLLCVNCNLGLGSFKDNPLYLTKAISYLEGDSLVRLAELREKQESDAPGTLATNSRRNPVISVKPSEYDEGAEGRH